MFNFEKIKSNWGSLVWEKAIVLIIAIILSELSINIQGELLVRLPFFVGSTICLNLFLLNKNSWINIFTILLILKTTFLLPNFFISFSLYFFYFTVNILPLVLLIVHLKLNKISILSIVQKIHKADKTKDNETQSMISRFEQKFKSKSKKELEDIIANSDVMTKEAIQAASNLLKRYCN